MSVINKPKLVYTRLKKYSVKKNLESGWKPQVKRRKTSLSNLKGNHSQITTLKIKSKQTFPEIKREQELSTKTIRSVKVQLLMKESRETSMIK